MTLIIVSSPVLSLLSTPITGIEAHSETRMISRSLIICAKKLFPHKVTFTNTRGLDLDMSFGELPWWLDGEGSTCSAGDSGLIPGSGRSPGKGNGYLLRCYCLENSMDGAWQATVFGIAKSQRPLSN